jgi:lipopolysaccharide export system protein LptA
MRAPLFLVTAMFVASDIGAQGVAPPSGRCVFRFDNTPTTRLTGSKLPSGQYNSFIGGGVIARCPAQNIVLRSDSLEAYGDEGRLYFVGHVDYVEPRLSLKSDFLTYYQRDERLLAIQNVDARLPSGSRLRGPQVEFFRAVPRVRPQQSATATGRPTVSLVERDAQGKPQPPVQVTGANIYLLGDSLVSAVGNVVVVRPELTATGDSLYANSGSGLLRLMREPKITGTKGRPFTLAGTTIDLLSRKRKLERVVAKDSAVATSEDLVLRADTLDLRVVDDLLQRAIAWGKSRARAASPTQTMIADSIDVLLPAQRVRTLYGVRAASAEGAPDTTKFRTTEKDRLTGDTIIAHFDTVATRDTSSKPRIRQLVAIGSKASLATSLQHLPPRDTSVCKPAINYVRGRLITVSFDSAKVSTVVVQDQDRAGGIYVEPQPDSTSRCRTFAAGVMPSDSGTVTSSPVRGSAPAPTQSPSSPPPAAIPAAPPATPKRP